MTLAAQGKAVTGEFKIGTTLKGAKIRHGVHKDDWGQTLKYKVDTTQLEISCNAKGTIESIFVQDQRFKSISEKELEQILGAPYKGLTLTNKKSKVWSYHVEDIYVDIILDKQKNGDFLFKNYGISMY